MARIDPNSDTWAAIVAWAQEQKSDAIHELIMDRQSEQQRGRIAALDALQGLAHPDPAPQVVADTYQ